MHAWGGRGTDGPPTLIHPPSVPMTIPHLAAHCKLVVVDEVQVDARGGVDACKQVGAGWPWHLRGTGEALELQPKLRRATVGVLQCSWPASQMPPRDLRAVLIAVGTGWY